MPREIELQFKNDDYFSKKKVENKPKNVNLFSNAKEENIKEAVKFNSANGTKTSQAEINKSNSFEDKSTNKGNDLHNLINGKSKNDKIEDKNVNKEEKYNESDFTFHNCKYIINHKNIIFFR